MIQICLHFNKCNHSWIMMFHHPYQNIQVFYHKLFSILISRKVCGKKKFCFLISGLSSQNRFSILSNLIWGIKWKILTKNKKMNYVNVTRFIQILHKQEYMNMNTYQIYRFVYHFHEFIIQNHNWVQNAFTLNPDIRRA